MKLYYTTRSPYARKVNIFAREKGIALELVAEDLKNKSNNLLQANPIGKVPTLLTDSGQAILDSSVICEYLEQLKPDPVLIPTGKERIKVVTLDAIAKGLTDITVAYFYENLLHPETPHQEFLKRTEETIVRTLRYFEEHVQELTTVNTASISVVCAIGYLQFRLGHLWAQASCPRLAVWYEGMLKRPSVAQTIPVE